MLTPTPSACPYGYSTWAGRASVGEVWLESSWAGDVRLLGGAVSRSSCWLLLWASCGVVAAGSVENGGMSWAVVCCEGMARDVEACCWGMVVVGLLLGCCWRCWLLLAVGRMGAAGAVGSVGVSWTVVVGC